MADIIPSLFGLTPEAYGQQQQTGYLNRGVQLAQLDPAARGAAMTYAGAAGLGNAIGGMLGAQDPQLKLITQQQEIMRGLDITDPVSLTQAARKASQIGNQDLALRLLTTADQMAQRAAQQQAQQELLQARQVSQTGGVSIDGFSPSPYRLGNSMIGKIRGLIAGYTNPGSMLG
jgi:hypothetical protein